MRLILQGDAETAPRGLYRVVSWPSMRLRSLPIVLFLVCMLCPRAVHAAAVISEVMWMGTDLSTADEWLEITGVDGATELRGWTLTSVNSSGKEVVIASFADGDLLADGEEMVIAHYHESASRLLVEPHIVASTVSLPNTKLLLRLRDGSGAVRDEVDDGVGEPMAGTNPSGGVKASMERVDLRAPGNAKENWKTASTFLGFDDGAPLLGTPGFPNGTGSSSDTTAPLEVTGLAGAFLVTGSGSTLVLSWHPSTSLDLAAQQLLIDPPAASGSSFSLPRTATGMAVAVATNDSRSITVQSIDKNGNISQGVHIQVEPLLQSTSSEQSNSSNSSDISGEVGGVHSGIYLTEVLPDAVGNDEAAWVEIGNLGGSGADIAGLAIVAGSHSYTIPPSDGSGYILASGAFAVFRNADTHLAFLHAGGTITLKRGQAMVDSLAYPEAEEGISYGRSVSDPTWTGSFCTPTPGSANVQGSWNPTLVLQSGKLRGTGSVTLNVQALKPSGAVGTMQCFVDFGDGTVTQSCNPGEHTYESAGRYILRAEMANYCGNTMRQDMTVEVVQEPSSEGGISPSAIASTIMTPAMQVAASSASQASSAPVSGTCAAEPVGHIRISGILPNPVGVDTEIERVDLENTSDIPVSLCGYLLSSASMKGKVFSLSSYTIPAYGTLSLSRKISGVTLTNTKDTVSLSYGSTGSGAATIIDSVSYVGAKEGKLYQRGAEGQFTWVSLEQSSPISGGGSSPTSTSSSSRKIVRRITLKEGLNHKVSSSKKSLISAKKTTVRTTKSTSQKLSTETGGMEDALALLTASEDDRQDHWALPQPVPSLAFYGLQGMGLLCITASFVLKRLKNG